MIRLGIFSDTITIPGKEGISVHVYELLISLERLADIEPIFFMCDRGLESHESIDAQPFKTVLVPEGDFFNIEQVRALIQQYHIDIAQTHKTYIGAAILGPACLAESIPMVTEIHDLEKRVVPLYFDSDHVEQAITDHVRFQKIQTDYSTLVRVMSKYDYDEMATTWPGFTAEKFHWLPVALDAGQTPELQPHRQGVYYVGNMSYTPNAEGAELIRDVIAPLDPAMHFTFIGRESERYSSKQINTLGMIDRLDDELVKAAVGIAPILSGSGMKIKNLTYLRYGIPVITTSLGAQGYPPSEAIIVEDDLTVWPSIIRQLLEDEILLTKLSAIARIYFLEHFGDDVINRKLTGLYANAIQSYDSRNIHALPPDEPIDPNHMYWIRELRQHINNAVTSVTALGGR